MGRCGRRSYRPIQVWVNLVGGKSPSGNPAGRLRGSQLRVQVSDHLSGDFKEQDEVNVVRLASLTSAALDTLVQLHLLDTAPGSLHAGRQAGRGAAPARPEDVSPSSRPVAGWRR